MIFLLKSTCVITVLTHSVVWPRHNRSVWRPIGGQLWRKASPNDGRFRAGRAMHRQAILNTSRCIQQYYSYCCPGSSQHRLSKKIWQYFKLAGSKMAICLQGKISMASHSRTIDTSKTLKKCHPLYHCFPMEQSALCFLLMYLPFLFRPRIKVKTFQPWAWSSPTRQHKRRRGSVWSAPE